MTRFRKHVAVAVMAVGAALASSGGAGILATGIWHG